MTDENMMVVCSKSMIGGLEEWYKFLSLQNGGEGEDPSSNADRGEWDNKSTSSVSEISVACLQDRIQQMEETHYW